MNGLKNASIVIVGVGGQGTLLASRILGALAVEENMEVKVSEVHGMAQRGGTVVTFVRIGESAVSPLIEAGGADYILAFEEMEAARALPYCKEGGTVIANTQRIMPMSVVTGAAEYPQDIAETIKARANSVLLDAYALAVQAGEPRAVNLVLMGALCAVTGGDMQKWEQAAAQCIPKKMLSVNLKAMHLGAQAALEYCSADAGEGKAN